MNLQKTEVEIVHSAYHHLWEHMQTKRLWQRVYNSQASRINIKKAASKQFASSL